MTEMMIFQKIDKGIIKDKWIVTGLVPFSLDWASGLLRTFISKPVGFQHEYYGVVPPGDTQAPVVIDVYVPVMDARLFGRGGPPCDMAEPEPDPLDDLLDAAGVGKEAGLGLPKHREYIKRTIEFDEAQKQSKAKIAEKMSDGAYWPESKLHYHADPRGTHRFFGAMQYMHPGVDYPDDDEEEKSD